MNKDSNGHTLTEKQQIQLAEIEAAKTKSGDTPVDTLGGGSDANSGPAKNAAPEPAGTPPGVPPTTTVRTTSGTPRP